MSKSWEQLEHYQPTVLKMIGNSIQKGRVSHAYLFEGSRGTGKREVSILFAKSLFCLNRADYKPCNACSNCRRISSGNHPDIHIVEPDGLSIKKGQIQALQEEFSKTGVESNKKLYIIDHADKMTTNAANSLLKFLEEPGKQTVAILLTEQVHRMLNTILSRCQVLPFKPLSPHVIAGRLQENGFNTTVAHLVAHVTNNLEDATDLCKDDSFAQSRKIVLQLYEVLINRPGNALFFIQDKWLTHFKEKEELFLGLDLLLLVYKDLLFIQLGDEDKVIYSDIIQELKTTGTYYLGKRVYDQIEAILEAKTVKHQHESTLIDGAIGI